LGKQPKENLKELWPQVGVPSADTDITKNISFSSRHRLQLDFLYPYTEATDKLMPARKRPDNSLQLNCYD